MATVVGAGVVPAAGEECAGRTYDGFFDSDQAPSPTATLQINGNSGIAASELDGSVLRVTSSAFNQAGSVFTNTKLALAGDGSFSSYFRLRFSPNGGGGADGLVFVVQNVASTVGGLGGGIGYANIAPSIGVEFDNWSNHFDLGQDPREPDDNHIGINVNGSILSEPVAPSASLPGYLDDGALWHSWVDYNGVTDTLEVRAAVQSGDVAPERPTAALLSKTIDLPAILGGDGPPVSDAYAGFTSGTGGAYGNHDVVYWQLNQCFDPIGAPEVRQADAGGPYTGVEGASVPLAGDVTGTTGPVTALWSAKVSAADAKAGCAVSPPAKLDTAISCTDDGTFTSTLTATDDGGSIDDVATVTLTNAKPAISLTSPPQGAFVAAGKPIVVSGAITDPGANDTHTCTVTWASGTTGAQDASRGRCALDLWLPKPGVYSLRVTATDDDGATSAAVTRQVTVCSNDPGAGATTITGGAAADVLCGTLGADSIAGNGGDDLVLARGGNDVVSGGTGADRLYGGDGVDRITGGPSKDWLYGEGGGDVANACGDGVGDQVNGGMGADTARRVPRQDVLSSVETPKPC